MSRAATRIAVASSIAFLGVTTQAHAQIARVFVSVNGNDANPCENIATPCRTFGAAIARVDANGEVIVLDSGSYGGTTITKAVRINVPPGIVAFAAQPFVVNVPGGVVALRGLTLKALTVGMGKAVTYTAAAALHVENCLVDGWQEGVEVNGTGELFIKDSTFRNIIDTAVKVQPPSMALAGTIDNSRFENNGFAVVVTGGKVSMRNSVSSGNNTGGEVSGGAFPAELNVEKCLLAHNLSGLVSSNGGTARISNSMITGNIVGFNVFGMGAVVRTFGNNALDGNGTDSTGTVVPIALQ